MKGDGVKGVVAKNIRKQMEIKGKNRTEICRELHISYSTFGDWYKGKSFPRSDKIEILAEYFGCSTSDITGEDANSKKEQISSDCIDAAKILEKYLLADDITKEMVRRILFHNKNCS